MKKCTDLKNIAQRIPEKNQRGLGETAACRITSFHGSQHQRRENITD